MLLPFIKEVLMIVIDETHAVGDTFIHDGIKLKVVEGIVCTKCHFFAVSNGCDAHDMKCHNRARRNGRSVIYQKKKGRRS